MVTRIKKNAPALKHGGYSATALLPGEDPAAFKKLHEALTAEFSPVGALEEDIVAGIARLVWRKRHLATFRVVRSIPYEEMTNRADFDPDKAAKEYQAQSEKLWDEIRSRGENQKTTLQEAMRKYTALIKQDYSIPQEEMFFRSGEITTMEQLMNVLAVEERLDTMIDRCLKRLLFLRGLKSIAPAKSASSPAEQKGVRKV
jgi:hypothetical protein